MLSRRELCAAQLRDRLGRRGYAGAEIEAAIQRLQRDGALDDRRMAEVYARHSATIKLRGRRRTLRELEARGIEATDARAAVDAVYGELDEHALLERALAKRRPPGIVTPAAFRRLHAALLRSGFESDAIVTLLRRKTTRHLDALPTPRVKE